MAEPIKLFWWKISPNFGDQLSAEIVSNVSGRPVQWASKASADLFALGSLMEMASRGVSRRVRRKIEGKPTVWGTGCMGPGVTRELQQNLNVVSLRGPLSATIMGIENTVYGDPGLLSKECFPHINPENKTHSVGIVLHFTQKPSEHVLRFLDQNPEACLINAGTNDTNEVLSKIASCETVLSTSLHGLVVADAFGVPNTWLSPKGIHKFYRFKFYDHALAVGRVLGDAHQDSQIETAVRQVEKSDQSYLERIPQIAENIRACFPQELLESSYSNEQVPNAANA